MTPYPDSEESLKRQLALVEEINGQTDRGVAIVAAAWVEEALEAAIYALLAKDPKAWQRLFGPNGPLGTFSSKIDLGRLLGIMSDMIKSDLHIIRDIRNEFAHRIVHRPTNEKLAFGSPDIRDKCFALKCIAHENLALPRQAFIRACAILNADFELLPLFMPSLGGDSRVTAKIENAA